MSRYNNSRPRTGKEIPTKPARDKNSSEIMKSKEEIIEEYKQIAEAASVYEFTGPRYIPLTRKMRLGAKWIHRDSDGQYKKKQSQ